MKEIIVPQLNANEDSCLLQIYHFDNRQAVKNDDVLVTLNTSKAAIDLASEIDGYFLRLKNEETDVKTGEVIGIVFESLEEFQQYEERQKSQLQQKSASKYKFTKQAEEFLANYEFAEEELASLNKTVIKLSDLERLLELKKQESVQKISLSRNQKMVARTVTTSYTTIPRAFLLMKINCNAAVKKIKEITEEFGVVIGFGEILTVIAVGLSTQFPFFYGKIEDENTFIPAGKVNVGVTIDTGNGLFIPIIKAENTSSIESVAEVMMDYKMKAMRNSFMDSDLMDGTISISLNTEDDIVCVLPIILPNQTAMISVGAVMKELVFDKDTVVAESSYLNIGLAYDHRVINGFQAMEYMKHIKARLENFDVKIYED